MATYEEIYGKRVEVLSSDPTLTSAYEGQVWYNSTTGTIKTVVSFASVRSSIGLNRSAPTMLQMASASGGPADANWAAGGNTFTNLTEEFNGTGWSNGGNLNTAGLNRSGFGTLPAGVCCGGLVPGPAGTNATEEYNATAWTSVNNMPEVARGLAGGGTLTAGIMYSGHASPSYPVASNLTKYYDGTNWSTPPATMNTSRSNASGCGTQTAALAVCGEPGPGTVAEEYNGTAWTTIPSLNTTRNNQGPATCQGSTTNASMLGGNPPGGTAIENYDGSSWTTNSTSLAGNQSQCAGFGTTAGTSIGVYGGGNNIAEEYNVSINTIAPAAWATGGNLPSARGGGLMFGVGTQTATVIAAGANNSPPPDYVNTTVEYNGASWTSANAIGQPARNSVGSAGTATAGLLIGGYSGTSGGDTTTEEYDGTNWTAGGALSNGYESGGYFGTQTAAVACAGTPVTGNPTKAEEYNGASWTSISAVGTGRVTLGGFGTETAGLVCGGMVGYPGSTTGKTEEYNGESWSEVSDLMTARYTGGPTQAGTQTAGMYVGGNTRPAKTAVNESYDGTVWASDVNLPAAWDNSAGTGTRTAALISGGYNPSITTTTLEYSPSTETVTSKTLTTS